MEVTLAVLMGIGIFAGIPVLVSAFLGSLLTINDYRFVVKTKTF